MENKDCSVTIKFFYNDRTLIETRFNKENLGDDILIIGSEVLTSKDGEIYLLQKRIWTSDDELELYLLSKAEIREQKINEILDEKNTN
jgi:hypothetical protein